MSKNGWKWALLLAAVAGAVPAGVDGQSSLVPQPLQRQIAPLHMTDQSVQEIAERLAGSAGVRVVVPWEQYRDQRFDVALSNLTVEDALAAILSAKPYVDPNGAVTIGDRPEAGDVTLRYSVGDLARADSAWLGRGMERLQTLVETMVRPDTWEDNAGTESLAIAGDTLVVRQRAGGHAEVQQLLDELRVALRTPPRADAARSSDLETAMRRQTENAIFDATPLRDVIQRLTNDPHINVIVDVDALEHAGVAMDQPITIDLSNMTVRSALELLIWRELRGAADYDIDDTALGIHTNDATARWGPRRIYDVREIIRGLTHDVPTAVSDPRHSPLWDKVTTQEADDQIAALIEMTIEPENWKHNGGAVGQLEFFGGQMIVAATPAAHWQLKKLLVLMTDAVQMRPAAPATPPPPRDEIPLQSASPKAFMDTPVDLIFNGTSLQDVLKDITEQTHARVFVNWKVLEAAGIDKNTPVTINVARAKFRNAIDLILTAVGGGQTKLIAQLDEDGILRISTAEDLSKSVVIRFYNIQALVEDALRVHRMFAPNTPNAQQLSGQDAVDELTKAIEDHIDTESWKDNGGATGSLRVFANTLIVTATVPTHEKLVAFLDKLKAEINSPRMTPGGR